MTIVMDDSTIALWCAEQKAGNLLMALSKKSGGNFLFQVRLRTYVDDKAYDSKDPKSFYSINFKEMSDVMALQRCRILWELFTEIPAKSWELLKGNDSHEQFLANLTTMPGISHKIVETKDEHSAGYGITVPASQTTH